MRYRPSPVRLVSGALSGLLLLLLQVAQAADVPEFSAAFGREHPLAGAIVQSADLTRSLVKPRGMLSPSHLIQALVQTDVVLLGETHDNPDHHALQRWVLRHVLQAGRRPGVVFEMMTEDQQPIVERYERQHPDDAALLGKALAWESSGWPAWPWYQPLADLAVGHTLPIIAGNLDPELTNNIRRFGFLAIPGSRRERLGLNTPITRDLIAMQEDMQPMHCQELSDVQLIGMVFVQHARDAIMAEHLTQTLSRPDLDGAVLIAGSWHTRTDYGVPAHVRRMAPEATVQSLAFIEVDDHIFDVTGYAQRFGGETVPFDFVWFTPRVSDDERCANMASAR